MTDIDITKPVRTRDRQPVEIISEKGRGICSLLGYIGDDPFLKSWTRNGKSCSGGSPNDIENVPARKERFYNVAYGDTFIRPNNTKEEAFAQITCKERVSTLHLTFEGDRLVAVDIVERFWEDGDESTLAG